jgi:predicted acetyltransferase
MTTSARSGDQPYPISLIRRQVADVRDRGEPLAVLWASESVIYSRYGYGRAMWHVDFTLYRGEGTLAKTAPSDSGLRLRIADPQAAMPELAKVYDAVLPSRPGFIARDEPRSPR